MKPKGVAGEALQPWGLQAGRIVQLGAEAMHKKCRRDQILPTH
jgi:hypothetical protein